MGDAERRRRRVEQTDEWERVGPLCLWPEQRDYEEVRPVTLFGVPVPDWAKETGSSERTLHRKVVRFEAGGMDSLFAAEGAKRRSLPPAIRRLVVDLKAGHPPMRPHEISTVSYVRFGRRPDYRTVERVLSEEPLPLRTVRRFPPYREIERFVRMLDAFGYATWKRWRVYGGEGLAGREAALWLREKTLTVEHEGETLSRYAVQLAAGTGKLRTVGHPLVFGTSLAPPQPRLFALSALGEGGRLKASRLEDYAPRRAPRVAPTGVVRVPRGMGMIAPSGGSGVPGPMAPLAA